MSAGNDASRAAFEAWHSAEFGWNSDTNPQWQKRLRIWQASRKAALEEAAKCAEDYPKYGAATAEEIRNLK